MESMSSAWEAMPRTVAWWKGNKEMHNSETMVGLFPADLVHHHHLSCFSPCVPIIQHHHTPWNPKEEIANQLVLMALSERHARTIRKAYPVSRNVYAIWAEHWKRYMVKQIHRSDLTLCRLRVHLQLPWELKWKGSSKHSNMNTVKSILISMNMTCLPNIDLSNSLVSVCVIQGLGWSLTMQYRIEKGTTQSEESTESIGCCWNRWRKEKVWTRTWRK